MMITTIPLRPQDISIVDALWVLFHNQTKSVRKALVKRTFNEEHEQQCILAHLQMVKYGLNRAFDELHSGKVHHIFSWSVRYLMPEESNYANHIKVSVIK